MGGQEQEELHGLVRNHELLDTVLRGCRLGPGSIHWISHWLRVLKNGLYIARFSGANIETVTLFAIFHDCMRRNEGYDPGHGAEGAGAARKARNMGLYQLEDREFDRLCYACRYHADGQVTSDVTVGTCWDADRLDLPRAGKVPDSRWMSTSAGRAAVEAYDCALWKKVTP